MNLARRPGMVDCGGVLKKWVTSIQIMVELWRVVAAAPVFVECGEFVIREHDEVDVAGGLSLLPVNVYDLPTPHEPRSGRRTSIVVSRSMNREIDINPCEMINRLLKLESNHIPFPDNARNCGGQHNGFAG